MESLRILHQVAPLVGLLCALSVPLACVQTAGEGAATELRAARNFLTGYPAMPDADHVHVVIEIPAGTNQKWETSKSGDALHWEEQNGRRRVVQYLAYPANYGMIPRTLLSKQQGGDGDPLDAIVLGAREPRGAVVVARPIGVLRLEDDGEQDDKILAVAAHGPLSAVGSLAELDAAYPGASVIIETWFSHYKGPGRLVPQGFADRAAALEMIRRASRNFEAAPSP